VTERVMIGRTLGGLFAMIGHAYPCLYKFKGGKGVISGGTVALFLDIRVLLLLAVVFLVAVSLTRYVSLGSILAGVMFPISFLIFGLGLWATLLALLCGVFVVYRHHENIGRLLTGQERRITFGRKKSDEDES